MVFGNKTNNKKYKKNNKIFRKMSSSKLVANKKRSNLVKLIKDIQMGQSEMKYKSGTYTFGNALHNNIYQIHAWSSPGTGTNLDIMPAQGVNDTTRIGDRIYVKGIKLRCCFQTVGDRLNTKIKVYWIPHNSEQGDPSSDLFHPITGSVMVDPLQKKRYPGIKYLGTHRVIPQDIQFLTAGTTVSPNNNDISFSHFVPIEKKVWFKADASKIPTNLKEYGTFAFCFYHNRGALITDVVMTSGDVNATLYYKDI
ncbi:MAG: putative capsid protein [Circoviridae sp.]|nr:MAG: putative capsid protein [Circoviridae sp.]